MFHIIKVKDVVRIPPSRFKDELKETIIDVISEEKVGLVDKDVGVVIGIVDVDEIGEASVILGDGAAYVNTTYSLLTFKPEIQNIYEGEIKDVAEFGAFMGLGPFDGLIHVSQIMDDFINFDAKNFAFVGKESGNFLAKGDNVIARLVSLSLKGNVTQSKLGLTMRQEGLGKEEWIEKEKKEKEKESNKKGD